MAEEQAPNAKDTSQATEVERDEDTGVQAMAPETIGQIVEAALLASEGPLTVDNLFRLFALGELDEEDGRKQIRTAIETLQDACEDRGVTLQKVSSGYRYQTRQDLSPWVSRLWEEKPPRYTRALLETLALVAYKQPVTRGDIEQVRGVSVSQNIMRTLLERDWIRVVGQREAPGRPSMYGTTKAFLDYFNLNKLEELPPLEEIKAMIEPSLVVDDNAAQTDDAVPSETPDGAAEELKEAVSVQEEAPVAEASDASATDAADDAQAETQS
jgi:segregation and condensation protein B